MSLIAVSCASGKNNIKNADYVADIKKVRYVSPVDQSNYTDIVKKYSINFKIPNPLLGEASFNPRRFDPNHENEILCRAILLDDVSSEAEIYRICRKDSLNIAFRDSLLDDTRTKFARKGIFRIKIDMESGFSEKSLEAENWAIYIENANGVMIEPQNIIQSPIIGKEDSVSAFRNTPMVQRRVMSREITLLFNKTTFFGQDLFSEKNPLIALVISQKKKTAARIVWSLSETTKKKN